VSDAPYEWYDYRHIKARNAPISIVAGPPSIGKTYGMKEAEIGKVIKNGRQLMWLRRTIVELSLAKSGFFDSIATQHPGFEFRVEGNAGQVKTDGKLWRTIVRFAALSTSYQAKGTEFPLVDTIVFDECFTPLGIRYLTDEVERLIRLWITVNRSRVDKNGRARTRIYMLGNVIELDNPYFLAWGFDASREWQKGTYTGGDVVLHLVDANKYEQRVSETIYGKALGTVQTDYARGDYFRSDGGYVVEDRPATSKPYATLVTMRGTFGLWEAEDHLTMYVTNGPLSAEKPVVAFEPMAVKPGIMYSDARHYVRKGARRHYRGGSMFFVGVSAMAARQALAR
jgi:Podovirus DNA encapsidation protein (Gp16)